MKPQLIHSLVLVGLGGSLGAAAREGLVLAIPTAAGLPWAIVVANLVGALLLGLLLSSLARVADPPATATHPEALPRRRRLQLLLGTGFCGGFTTYSTLAVGIVNLTEPGAPGLPVALAYGLGTVLLGGFATWVGMLWGSRS